MGAVPTLASPRRAATGRCEGASASEPWAGVRRRRRPGRIPGAAGWDHGGSGGPWRQVGGGAGGAVGWAEVGLPAGELPVEQYKALVSERTRLVAVTAASNVLGTRPDVGSIAALAHEVGALTYVDGVHATPHGPVDIAALGADFYTTSAYKWSGPHVGAVIADPALLSTLSPMKLASSPGSVPERFETGTGPLADLARVAAAAGIRRAHV